MGKWLALDGERVALTLIYGAGKAALPEYAKYTEHPRHDNYYRKEVSIITK